MRKKIMEKAVSIQKGKEKENEEENKDTGKNEREAAGEEIQFCSVVIVKCISADLLAGFLGAPGNFDLYSS
jgi:hypothetical protein